MEMRARAFAASASSIGTGHPETVRRKHDLATAALRSGQPERAIRLFGESLEARTRRSPAGTARLEAIGSLAGLAEAAGAGGYGVSARTLKAMAIRELERELGPRHPATLKAMDALAGTLEAGEGRAEAWAARVRSVAGSGIRLGQGWLRALAAAGGLAAAEIARNDMRAACSLRLEALTARLLDLGPCHPDTVSSSARLERALAGLATAGRERDLAFRELDARAGAPGAEHPLSTLERLGLSDALAGLGGMAPSEDLSLE
jgi:hypothetical protein